MSNKASSRYLLLLLIFLISATSISVSQTTTSEQSDIQIIPDKDQWTYHLGDVPRYTILVSNIDLQKPIIGHVEIGPEKMPPVKTEQIELVNGQAVVEGITMKQPGFVTCKVTVIISGKEHIKLLNAGFEPEKIIPTSEMPSDFVNYWEECKAESVKIPLASNTVLLPERCTDAVNVYEVRFNNYRHGAQVYGILCIPVKKGKYPALLKLPGSGIKSYPDMTFYNSLGRQRGDIAIAEKGVITLEIGIHGIPVTLDKSIYSNLSSGPLYKYMFINLDNKDEYYFNRVYMGCYRAVEFLASLPEYDGENMGVCGRSQGGALTIVTAALNVKVKHIVVYFPALCDLTGYVHGRAGGWPHMFYADRKKDISVDKINTALYYDVVNFGRILQTNGFYCFGYNDFVCPPTSMYAAYNIIKAPKYLNLRQDTGHAIYPELCEISDEWMLNQLLK